MHVRPVARTPSRTLPTTVALLVACTLAIGCQRTMEASRPDPAPPGGPLATLDAWALQRWHAGKVLFEQVYTPEAGLGPYFNAPACSTCHDRPNVGGHGDMTRAARLTMRDGDITGLPQKALAGFVPLAPVAGVPVSVHRPPPLYGLGQIEAIDDHWLETHCGTNAQDGIAGLSNRRAGQSRPGRFGYKAHAVTLVDFIANAMSLEMGVTNPLDRDPHNQKDQDAVADPEANTATVEAIAEYVRGLAPPKRLPSVPEGERLFHDVGCATCHRPETAPGVFAFSDVCLHDLGPAFDNGMPDFLARPSQWRTAMLWGLRFRDHYFHDDRATGLDQAIRMHGAEANRVRQRYQDLPAPQQAALRAFLATL